MVRIFNRNLAEMVVAQQFTDSRTQQHYLALDTHLHPQLVR
jgi:hypothetical protein